MNNQPFSQKWHKFRFATLLSLAFLILTTAAHAEPQVVFNANPSTLGAIPDGTSTTACQTPGAPLNVTFNVSGLTGNVQSVAVTVTFNPAHTWAGDVVATLIAPNGTTQLDLFGYTRATTATGAGSGGDDSVLAGPYTFSDAATGNWWSVAAATGEGIAIPSGSYRTSQRGGAGGTGAVTSLNAVFGGLTAAQANGTWTLRFIDGCREDTGSVSAASLDITTGPTTPIAVRKPFGDFFGSGRSSFATIGVSGNNLIWRLRNNGGTGQENVTWGLTTDFITPGYYDSDNRTDVSVYRQGTAASPQGFYFSRLSSTNTLQAQPFGSGTGDFGTREGDYDGDGRYDYTIIRRVGGRWQWVYLASQTSTVRVVSFGTGTGDPATEDIPLAGEDYTGDGRDDLTVVRQNASGTDTYLIGDSQTGALVLAQPWGEFNTDFYVIGDFLGDARADFAVWRALGSGTDNGVWFIKENGGAGTFFPRFGIPGAAAARDFSLSGDYNGDGKNDVAVWRPSNQTFYWLNSPYPTAGVTPTIGAQQFGTTGDTPVGALRTY